jgi:hypothetical protein
MARPVLPKPTEGSGGFGKWVEMGEVSGEMGEGREGTGGRERLGRGWSSEAVVVEVVMLVFRCNVGGNGLAMSMDADLLSGI